MFIAYGYSNMDYIANSVYRPLQDAISPVMMARQQLQQQKLTDMDGKHFLNDNDTLRVVEQTLDEHCASVVGAAAEVHIVFQIMVAGMLSDGSPNILLYMMSYAIITRGAIKIFDFIPKQIKKISKWAQSGMEEDLQVVDIWNEFRIDHLANGAFFLSTYVIIEMLAMSPIDCFSHEMEGTMIIIGLAVMLAARFFRNGKYKEVGRKSGICIGLAPLVLNYVTGAPLFKVAAWMTVTWFQNPDVFWEYLTYAMIVGEILKAPKEWKIKFDERKLRQEEERKNQRKKTMDSTWRVVSSASKWRKKAVASATKKKKGLDSAIKKGANKGETKQEK